MSYSDSDSDKEHIFELWQAVYHDDKKAFLDFVNVDPSLNKPCLAEIMSHITTFDDCFECAKAVLEGQTGHIVDLSAPVETSEVPPLHELARCHCTSMIELFLSYGAPVNLRCTTDDKLDDGMLPFNYALKGISCNKNYLHSSWTTKHSVFNLIIRMCLPEMREALKTVKLLASRTEDFYEEIFYYAREGKVLELAAILLVVHEEVLSPALLQGRYGSAFIGSTTLRQFVTAEITLLEATRIRLEHSLNHQMLHTCKEMLVNMMHLLQLLEIFERAGDQLAAYIMLEPAKENSEELLNKKTSLEVAWLLEQEGFTLKDEDLDLVGYEELLLQPFHEGSMRRTMSHPFDKSYWRTRNSDLMFLGPSLPCCMQEDSLQHPQQGNAVQKKTKKKQGSDVVKNRKKKKQGSKGNSQKGTVKDTENFTTDPSPLVARPYKQWRFASTEHLCRSHSFSMQTFEQLRFLDDVNSSCEGDQSKCKDDRLHLSMAIERLCHHQYFQDWSNRKSIFKLLYILCLPDLKEELEHIKLSACNIGSIEALGCYYAKEGKVIELAILLFVAREKLVPSTESSSTDIMVSDKSMLIGKCLMSEIQRLIDAKMRMSQCNELDQMCEDKKSVLLSALLLLDVFEQAGDAFEKYLRSVVYADYEGMKEEIAYDVASILQTLGFVLTEKDIFVNDLNCFLYKPREEELETLKIKIGSLISSKLQNVSRPKKIDVAYRQRRDHAFSFPCNSLHAYNQVQSFHTVPNSKASSALLSSPLQNQVHGVPVKYDPPLLNFLFGERWMSFALAIKRGMKRV